MHIVVTYPIEEEKYSRVKIKIRVTLGNSDQNSIEKSMSLAVYSSFKIIHTHEVFFVFSQLDE